MSTYDLLLGRLQASARELTERANELNQERMAVFGSSVFELKSTERLRSENANVPRDVANVGDELILAFHPAPGSLSATKPEDIFAVHHLTRSDDGAYILSPNPDGLTRSVLDDNQFRRDFDELHTYFKETRVQQLYQIGNRLLSVFRTGSGAGDTRVLRWSVEADGSFSYLDARGERDHVVPPRHDVSWTLVTRDEHVGEDYITIEDRVFVSPLRGTVEIMLPDRSVLLSDGVEHADQSLQDCTVRWASSGDLIFIDLLPYAETEHRFYVVNLLNHTAVRLDALGQAFRVLPEGQGVIYPRGVYLKNGQHQDFDIDADQMELLRVVRSPNGEDILYVFYDQDSGRSILLPYNVVRQQVTTALWCHGHTIFADGTMVLFREEPEPTRIHPVQLWDTPFCSEEWFAAQPREQSKLDRIGNPQLVAGIADATAVGRLVEGLEPSVELFGDLLGSVGRFLDQHYWADSDDANGLAEPARDMQQVAGQVISEFERVLEIQAEAAAQLAEAEATYAKRVDEEKLSAPSTTEGYIDALAAYRQDLGHLHTIRDLPQMDIEAVDVLVGQVQEGHDSMAQRAASHLATDGAFAPYHQALDQLGERSSAAASSVEAGEVLAHVDAVAQAMDVVATTVGDLVVDDPTVRTSVLEQVSQVLASINRVRATVEGKQEQLVESETGASFATELGLFGQTISSALSRVDTPEAADEALGRLSLQLEQLETAGPRTSAQLDELNMRREQMMEAVASRRQKLVDERESRGQQLLGAAERTLERIEQRASALDSVDAVNGFFAADPMSARVRDLIEQLRSLGEAVKADELKSQLGAAQDNAARLVVDRAELYEEGLIKLGRHRFSVDAPRRELTIVPRDGALHAVLTGTDYSRELDDERLGRFSDLWDQPLASESDTIYRAAYLAAQVLDDALQSGSEPDWSAVVGEAVDSRLDEGYDRGVHDHDAERLAAAWYAVCSEAGPLLHSSQTRADALWHWFFGLSHEERMRWEEQGAAAAVLGQPMSDELGTYLAEELTNPDGFKPAVSTDTAILVRRFSSDPRLAEVLPPARLAPAAYRELLRSYVATDVDADRVDEVVVGMLIDGVERRVQRAELTTTVGELLGRHPTIIDGELTVPVDQVLEQARHQRDVVAPRHREFSAARHGIISDLRQRLRVDELVPRVPEGFVRNQLIDQVYLPLIGDNFARQIGTVDDSSGARSGLLMLLSPPGYGKTTLMEYVADRLGMALVKVSGPGLGHEVVSLDPAQAPSATAAREIERINLAMAIGSNVILYVDDIQHTNPELLQRFISLTDGQRRIEGVLDGEATTFDLRGKRFAVVMAGNPYTESGERFRVPDMLSNRADTYNLGDVLADSEHLFALSYIENALTTNPTVARVGRDLPVFMPALDGAPVEESALSQRYSAAEQNEIVSLLRHLRAVQQTVLTVNRQYIASAATADDYRTEPPFLLQGSYRNMARMGSKLLPAMTPAEVEQIVVEHYNAESQTLTGDAEANLLKLASLRETLDEAQAERWAEILDVYQRQKRLGGGDQDPVTRVVAAIDQVAGALADGIASTTAPTGQTGGVMPSPFD